MDKTLETTLIQAGVSAAALALLEKQELSAEAALKRGFTYEQFRKMGILAGSARVLADLFPPPLAPVAPQSVTQPAPLYLGRLPLSHLLQGAATGDTDAIAQLRERFGEKTVFVRDLATGKLDIAASLACIVYVGIDSPVDHWEGMPTESLSQILAERRYANPLTGKALVPGDSWLTVEVSRRRLAAFGVLTLALNPLGVDEETIIEQLSRSDLSGRWIRIANAYEVASKRNDATVHEAERRLYESQGRSSRSSGASRGSESRGYNQTDYWTE